MIQKITPTEHEKREWARLAQAAHNAKLNEIGHEFDLASSLKADQQMDVERFDHLQSGYRGWLNNGTFPAMTHRRKVVRAFMDAETVAYEARVRSLEAEGLSRSDAQSAVEAEDFKARSELRSAGAPTFSNA